MVVDPDIASASVHYVNIDQVSDYCIFIIGNEFVNELYSQLNMIIRNISISNNLALWSMHTNKQGITTSQHQRTIHH